ncbi:MAG: c-type cytochrome [Candidatus Cyclobacteriaceae bacterium M3_2C_046]
MPKAFFYLIFFFSLWLNHQVQSQSYNDTLGIDTVGNVINSNNLPDTIPTYNNLVRAGSALFQAHCTACHAIEFGQIGPALASVHQKHPLKWLLNWINNPDSVIQSGDEYAIYLRSQYDTLMPSFNFLSDDQKFAILAYIKSESIANEIPTSVASVEAGENLFNKNCIYCHNVGQQKLGPALASVHKRRSLPWLMRFIRNSQEVIENGDDYAIFLYERYNNMVMPSFQHFSDEDILNILSYIKDKTEPEVNFKQYSSRVSAAQTSAVPPPEQINPGNTQVIGYAIWFLIGAIVLIGLAIIFLVYQAILGTRFK